MVTLLYRTLAYDTVIRRTWVMAAGSNSAFKIAAKSLTADKRHIVIPTAYSL